MSESLRKIKVGSTIAKVRWMTMKEQEKEGWEGRRGVVLEMVGGGKIYAARDEEGNGPGTLFGETDGGEGVYIIPEEPYPAAEPIWTHSRKKTERLNRKKKG